jgi:hypothetical protein
MFDGTGVPPVNHAQDARATIRVMLYWPRETRPCGAAMADTSRFTIICPCCEATLSIDANTGALLSHEEKQKPLASFEGLVKDLDKQKQTREQIFAQEMSSMKDRERLLEEKFKDAMKRADKDKGKAYKNPLDLD